MKNIIFIAPPAGGKGTQSDALVEKYGYLHISTGDLLREIDKSTPLGQEVAETIEKGNFVGDELIFKLLKERLTLINDKPFILDGVPRSLKQANMLDELLGELNLNLSAVIYLDVPYDVLLKRVSGRVSCPKCKTIYNKYFKKPLLEGICDKCNEKLTSRSDDDENTYKVRYDTYIENTLPLIDYYDEKGILFKIDGVNNIFENIVSVINDD